MLLEEYERLRFAMWCKEQSESFKAIVEQGKLFKETLPKGRT